MPVPSAAEIPAEGRRAGGPGRAIAVARVRFPRYATGMIVRTAQIARPRR